MGLKLKDCPPHLHALVVRQLALDKLTDKVVMHTVTYYKIEYIVAMTATHPQGVSFFDVPTSDHKAVLKRANAFQRKHPRAVVKIHTTTQEERQNG